MKIRYMTSFIRVFLALVLMILCFSISRSVGADHGAEWWVCPTGDCGNPGSSFNSLQAAVNAAGNGDTIFVQPGTYLQSVTIQGKTLTIQGTGNNRSEVVFDGSTILGWVLHSDRSSLTLRGLTFIGSSANYYGLKIEGGNDVSITDVTVRSSGRSNIDFNGVTGITITNVAATGSPRGVGLAFTDSRDAVITELTTSGNAWGGLAVFTRGQYFPGGSDNIRLIGSNDLAEPNPIYVQVGNHIVSEPPYPATRLTFEGYDYTIGNHAHPAFTWYRTSLQAAVASAIVIPPSEQSYVRSVQQPDLLFVMSGMKIQAAIDASNPNDTIRVYPGSYLETASNRRLFNDTGPYQFGLFFPVSKPGLTVQGVDDNGVPISAYEVVAAQITTNATNNFGPSGIFVEGDRVTMRGLRILHNITGLNKTIEVIGDDFTLEASVIDDPDGSVYLNDWRFNQGVSESYVKSYTIRSNHFAQGSTLDIAGGAGFSGPTQDRIIHGNTFEDSAWAVISFSGTVPVVPWFEHPVSGATITGNTFKGGTAVYIRARGVYNESTFDWTSYFNDNTFDRAVISGVNPPGQPTASSYTITLGEITNVRKIGTSIQGEVNTAAPKDIVLVKSGNYSETVTVSKPLTITTTDKVTTILDGGFQISADDVEINSFTIRNGFTTEDRAGVYVTEGVDGVTIRNNILTGTGPGAAPAARGILTGYHVKNLLVEGNLVNNWVS